MARIPRLVALLGVLSVSISFSARAAVIVVPTDYPTIQLAVTAAADGDTVRVRPGTYVESVAWSGKDLTLIAVADLVEITTQGTARVVTIGPGGSSGSRLEGFAITKGAPSAGRDVDRAVHAREPSALPVLGQHRVLDQHELRRCDLPRWRCVAHRRGLACSGATRGFRSAGRVHGCGWGDRERRLAAHGRALDLRKQRGGGIRGVGLVARSTFMAAAVTSSRRASSTTSAAAERSRSTAAST
mgnify:CR=1 FL=1